MPDGMIEKTHRWWGILPCFKFETTTYESIFGGFSFQKTKFIGSKIAEKIYNTFFSTWWIKKQHIYQSV